jgi:hypothetical protein
MLNGISTNHFMLSTNMTIRLFRLYIFAAIWLSATASALAQQGVVTTNPSPPQPNQPFEVSVTAQFPAFFGISPLIDIQGGTITVYLQGNCFFVCPGPVIATKTFTAPALSAGNYVMTIFPGTPTSPGQAVGQLAFTVGAISVPALGAWGILVLTVLLFAFAAFSKRSRQFL